MSTRESNVRLKIESISDLPEVADQYRELIKLSQQHLEATKQAALSARTNSLQEVSAIQSVSDALKAQQAQQRKTDDEAAAGRQKTNKDLDNLASGVRNFATLVATAFTLNEIKTFGQDVIDAKTKIDSLKIALDVMLGSKKESAALYDDIVKLAKTTPFSLEEVADNVVKLKAYNIATADLIPTVNALGNIAAAVGKDKLPQLTLAYGQVINMGKLMGQETRQFVEAGVPLYDLLSASMQKPKEEVIKLAQEHRIMAADVKKAIMDASDAGGKYYNLMALQSKTLGGEVSNLGDAYFVAKARVGDFFEGSLKNGIRTLADFVTGTVGSNSAISRTIDIVKGAVAAFVTYQSITNSAAAASALLAGYEAAKNVIYGTYLLTLRAVTQQQVVYTASQQAATVAATGFGAALAANPIGAVVTAVGLLVTAFYAYKSITDEVVSALGEEEIKIKQQQTSLNTLAESAMSAAMGTKERKEAMELLISKYPEYFAGLSAEKTNNSQLKTILDSVNGSYAKRIDLAREAYKTEGIANAQKDLFEMEEKFFNSLAKLGDDTLNVQFGGSVKKLVAALDAGGVAADNIKQKLNESASGGAEFYAASARNIVSQFDKVEKASLDSSTRTKKITDDAKNAEVVAIQAHYKVLIEQADGNKGKIAALKKQENDEIAKATGTFHEEEIKTITTHEEKKKTITLLSAKEIASLIKGAYAETLSEQIAALRAQEKEEIEAVNKRVVNKKISSEQLAALERQARDQILAIHQETEDKIQALRDQAISDLMVDSSEYVSVEAEAQAAVLNLTTQTAKEKAKAVKDANKEIIKDNRELAQEAKALDTETRRLDAETAQIQISSKKQLYSMAIDLISQQSGLLGELGQSAKALYMNWDALSGKTKAAAEERYATARQSLNDFRALYDENSAADLKKLAELENAAAQAKNTVAKTTAETNAATLSMYATAFNIAVAITKAIGDAIAQTYLTIADALQKARDAYAQYFDSISAMAKENLDYDMERYKDNFAKREEILKRYYEQERERVSDRTSIDIELAKIKETAEAKSHTFDTMTQYQRRMDEVELNYSLAKQQRIIDLAKVDRQEAEDTYNLRLEKINAEFDAFKKAKDAEIELEKQAFETRKQLNEVFYSDKQLRLQEDDTYRAQLLQQGEAREVRLLEEAKQRELQRAAESNASAEEVANITNAFNELIAAKHKEYQDAIGNKAKETSLAIQETKSAEKDEVDRLEKESADKTKAIQADITAREKQAAFEKSQANAAYEIAKNGAQRQQYEAEKQMQIASLQAEQAILRSKRWFMNAGKINEAIGFIQEAINTISGQSFPTGPLPIEAGGGPGSPVRSDGVPLGKVYDEKKNEIIVTYDDKGHVFDAYDENGKRITIGYGTGFAPATGQKYFQGTEFVQGLGLPDGIDTVPAMLTKGERVLTVDENSALNGISNEQVVERIKYYDILQAQFPDMLDPARWADIANSTMRLPEGIMNSQGGSTIDIGQLVSEMQDVKRAIVGKKETHISLDRAGYSTYTVGVQSKIKRKEAVFKD